MKKLLTTAAITLSIVSFTHAQEAVTTTAEAPALPPVVSTGNASIDKQIQALHREMEAKIKAIREEYQKKLKVLVGERRVIMASTTRNVPQEVKREVKRDVQEIQKERKEAIVEMRKEIREEVRGTSTQANPRTNFVNFFRKFFGQNAPIALPSTETVAQ